MTPKQLADGTRKRRLTRIHTASVVFISFTGFGLLMSVYWLLAFLLGWPFFSERHPRIVISHSHLYASPSEMPPEIFSLWLVQVGFGFLAALMLIALFRLYERGIFFSAQNILYIRFFGYWLIINWVLNYLMQGALKDMDLSMTPVFVGFLVNFIAWIMDEGRKLQEEQELTV